MELNSYVFVSENNDIIIEFKKEKIRSFSFTNESNYICKLIFKNNMGCIIRELSMSEITVSILLDNIYSFLEFGMTDVYIHLNSFDTNCIDNAIKIDLYHNQFGNYIQTFTLYDYINEQLVKILSFEITDKLVEFCNYLYYIFLSNDDKYILQDPSNFL